MIEALGSTQPYSHLVLTPGPRAHAPQTFGVEPNGGAQRDLNNAQRLPAFIRRSAGSAVTLAVDNFYKNVLADELKHFFVGIDMTRQREHQKKIITYAFGGSGTYDGRGMREAHRPLVERIGLNDSHFDAVVENLAETLTELGVDKALIGEVANVAESIRDDVLCR